MPVDRQSFQPPEAPARPEPHRVPGALGGSLLWEQPALAAQRARLQDFLAPGPPIGLEIGFDHGISLLAQARAKPEWRWLGVELRRRRVEAILPLAPLNCLPLRADARSLLATSIPPGRLHRVDILFPTPSEEPRHQLFSAAFVADLARAMAPGAVLHVETDVRGLFDRVLALVAAWPAAPAPPPAPALSRRQRVCRRDGIPVFSLSRFVPSG